MLRIISSISKLPSFKRYWAISIINGVNNKTKNIDQNFLNLLEINGNKIDNGVSIKKLPTILYKPNFNPNLEFNNCLIE